MSRFYSTANSTFKIWIAQQLQAVGPVASILSLP